MRNFYLIGRQFFFFFFATGWVDICITHIHIRKIHCSVFVVLFISLNFIYIIDERLLLHILYAIAVLFVASRLLWEFENFSTEVLRSGELHKCLLIYYIYTFHAFGFEELSYISVALLFEVMWCRYTANDCFKRAYGFSVPISAWSAEHFCWS